jgi:hypothetical protein
VPEISRFYGIIIRMFAEAHVKYYAPHFHAYYQNDVAVYSIEPVELISGSLPKRQSRLVEAWAELHQSELWNDWQRLKNGQKSVPIEPLK